MGNWLQETVDLIRHRKAGKRELLRLPKDEVANAFNDGWLDRFWSLPAEAWPTAVDLRLEDRSFRQAEERNNSAERIAKRDDHLLRSRRFWSEYGCPYDPPEEAEIEPKPPAKPEPPTAEELEELQRIAEKLKTEVARPVRFTGEFLKAIRKIERSEQLIKQPSKALGEPWDGWIATLPEEAREEGALACLLWRDMIRLRSRLHEAIEERRTLAGIIEDDAQRVLDVRMFELRGKIEACEQGFSVFAPFFDRYGKPPLAEVPGEPAGKPARRTYTTAPSAALRSARPRPRSRS